MGQQFTEISQKNIEFINQQKLFFVGTATDASRVNISPKGMDSLRVINSTRVIWLNVTGSGNETAAHIQVNDRMTIMFLAFDGSPNILRLYGHATVIHKKDAQWSELARHFEPLPGARQIFDMKIDLVQNSCGMSVPVYSFKEDRHQLTKWAESQGQQGIEKYWQKKNQTSLDGLATHIMDKNT